MPHQNSSAFGHPVALFGTRSTFCHPLCASRSAPTGVAQPGRPCRRRPFHCPPQVERVEPAPTFPANMPIRSCAVPAQSLLIVGAGVLGRCIAKEWQARHQGALVVGETRSEATHAELAELGLTPALNGHGEGLNGGERFSRVVFCAPPGGNPDYPAAVAAAAARVAEGGVFVFTSSGSVYKQQDLLNEDSPVLTEGERALRLLEAENAATQRPEGRVVRLAGLYSVGRGAHSYWLRASGVLKGSPQSVVNMVHYDDAASMVVACLEASNVGRRLFLAADGAPMTREHICRVSLEHPMFSEYSMPTFDGVGPVAVKKYENVVSREALGWSPQYASFASFMKEDAARISHV